MTTPIYPTKNANAQAICHPRWKGWTPKSKHDPCGGCPLFEPCVRECPRGGLEAFTSWVKKINRLADSLHTQHHDNPQ